jgi:hypothetical protein
MAAMIPITATTTKSSIKEKARFFLRGKVCIQKLGFDLQEITRDGFYTKAPSQLLRWGSLNQN